MVHKNCLTNKSFCYWLQGYFEISDNGKLNKDQLIQIQSALLLIAEPLGVFTQWLSDVLVTIEEEHYQPMLINIFTNSIQSNLNDVFLHVIDPTYDAEHAREKLLRIHRGEGEIVEDFEND